MKKLFMLFILLLVGTVVKGQESLENESKEFPSKGKKERKEMLEMSLATGYNWLLNSNLSPYGQHYRGNYKGGIIGAIDAFYCFDKWKVGVLFSTFSTSGNYGVEGRMVSEDIQVNYIAPQYKTSTRFAKRWVMSGSIGVGYLWYSNDGWLDNTGYKVSAHALGINSYFEISCRLLSHMDVFVGTSYWGASKIKKFKVEAQGEKKTVDLDDPYRLKFITAGLLYGIRVLF